MQVKGLGTILNIYRFRNYSELLCKSFSWGLNNVTTQYNSVVDA